jgi:hypothetical protein
VRRAVPRLALRLLPLVPVVFAEPVFGGIAATIANLDVPGEPYLGYDSAASFVDARALGVGAGLYGDPDAGYFGLPLTPLYTVVLAGANEIHLSTANGVLLSIVGGLALAAMTGRLAYGRGRDHLLPLLGALGIAALAWWLVSFVPFNFLFDGRSDQPAWAVALGGLLLTPAAAGGSRVAFAGAVVLLSAAFWTKQPAGVAALAAVVWFTAQAVGGRARPGAALAFAGCLVGLNLVVFGVLALVSSGWSSFFVVELPAAEPRDQSFGDSLGEGIDSAGPAALVAGALWLAYVLGRPGAEPAERRDREHVSLLLAFAVLGTVAAAIANTKIGSVQNQYVGVAWAFAMLAAIAWRRGLPHPQAAVAGAAVIVCLLVGSQLDGVRSALRDVDVFVPHARSAVEWEATAPELERLARRGRVYHPVLGDLNASPREEVYPTQVHLQDLLAGGRQPRDLVERFLDRRFAFVFLLDERRRFERYASGAGRREENYLWKLNEVLRARYRPAARPLARAGLPPGANFVSSGPLVRRPGPEPARWMRSCFGPFEIAGVEWEIGRGGGFWCRRGETMTLRRTRVASSELRASEVAGSLRGRLPSGIARVLCDGDELDLRRRGPAFTAEMPSSGCGALSLLASRGSGAAFDVGRLRPR